MKDEKSHPLPVTRRQFLAAGIGSTVSYLMAPTLLSSLLSKQARADGVTAGNIPLLVFDCVGGAALPGNWLVGKEGGPDDRLRSYDGLGLGSSAHGNDLKLDTQFGAPMVDKVSQVLAGILAATSPGARANLRMGTLCNESQDDNSGNPLSILGVASKAGSRGKFLEMGLGTSSQLSGGNSAGVVEGPSYKPMALTGADDVAAALKLGPYLNNLSASKQHRLLKTILGLSQQQLGALSSLSGADAFGKVLGASAAKADEFLNGSPPVDPRKDTDAQAAFGITADSESAQALNAAIAFNVIQGNCGPGVITIGGCDYHDGTSTTGDGIDLKIGTAIGQAVEFAHRRQKPLFFTVITDGGIYSDPGTRNWRGDAGIHGLAVVGYYNPKGPTKMRRTQIGAYTDGQAVQRTTYIGQMPARAAWAAFANYLAVCGRIGEFESFIQPNDFEIGQLDAHLFFA